MRDERVAVVDEAFEKVRATLYDRAQAAAVADDPSASPYRLAYLLAMSERLTMRQLTAIDHFQRAHVLLTNRSIPPSPEAVAEFVETARQLLDTLRPDALAA